jgi:hypothetical protein
VRQRGGGADTRDSAGSGRGREERGVGRTWADPKKERSGSSPDEQ